MPASLAGNFAAATSSASVNAQPLTALVCSALKAQAEIVIAESGSTTNHANRATYATAVLRHLTADQCAPIALAVASDGVTSAASSDADILARVAALWNGLAGVV